MTTAFRIIAPPESMGYGLSIIPTMQSKESGNYKTPFGCSQVVVLEKQTERML
jgi:hypothetical protein